MPNFSCRESSGLSAGELSPWQAWVVQRWQKEEVVSTKLFSRSVSLELLAQTPAVRSATEEGPVIFLKFWWPSGVVSDAGLQTIRKKLATLLGLEGESPSLISVC